MIYIGYNFVINPVDAGRDILVAELAEVGFESFVETDDGISAYILKDDWHKDLLKDIQILESDEFNIDYTFDEIKQVNWNSEWEKNFNPIMIDDKVSIRAPFHKQPQQFDYDIIIEPKMSFGTGHHETTHVMVQYILELDLQNKKVLDMGCGTGILAILAEMRGASNLDAIDIDAWCYENTLENIERNNCHHIKAFQGDAKLLNNKYYDVVIANINRNILLNDIKMYAACLSKDGVLLLSGFYFEDIELITAEALKNGLKKVDFKQQKKWIGMRFFEALIIFFKLALN